MTYLVREVHAHDMTWLTCGYTNESRVVPNFLSWFREWVDAASEHEVFLGLDVEFTPNHQGVAVIQPCFKHHVLIFQWASSDKKCPKLMDFLRSGIRFTSVDITNDMTNMRRNFGIEIPAACHIDLQGLFQLDYLRT
ncbi:hypothetical protein D1007_60810 [Hordeum vulgare]|nr:hypothetical protein D1007_60810 [Hordeum vulgare]